MSSSIIALRLVVRRTLQCFIVWNQFVSQKEHQTGDWRDPYKLLHPIPSYHKTFTPITRCEAIVFVGTLSQLVMTMLPRQKGVCSLFTRPTSKMCVFIEDPDFLFSFRKIVSFSRYYLHSSKYSISLIGIFHVIGVKENQVWNYCSNLCGYLLQNKILFYKSENKIAHPLKRYFCNWVRVFHLRIELTF